MDVVAMEPRGVVSLFVIAFFLIVFVTFLIMAATRYDTRRAARRAQARNEERGAQPDARGQSGVVTAALGPRTHGSPLAARGAARGLS